MSGGQFCLLAFLCLVPFAEYPFYNLPVEELAGVDHVLKDDAPAFIPRQR